MKYVFIAVSLALTGCASTPPPSVYSLSSMELCTIAVNGSYRYSQSQIYSALQGRNENCQAYMPMIQAANNKRANDDAAINGALNMLNAARPKPASTTSCSTYKLGNTLQTDCR